MLVVDDRLEAHVGGFCDQQVDFLAHLVVGRRLVEVAIKPRSGGNALGVFVEINMHHAVFTGAQLAFFFRIRQQQILGQAPVEEHADTVDFNNFQTGKLANLNFGFFGRGDKFVIAVQINENVKPVFIFTGNIFGDVPIRQEDFTVLRTVQVQTEVRVFNHLQAVVAPD